MVAYGLGPMGGAWAFAKILRQIDPRQGHAECRSDCEIDDNYGDKLN